MRTNAVGACTGSGRPVNERAAVLTARPPGRRGGAPRQHRPPHRLPRPPVSCERSADAGACSTICEVTDSTARALRVGERWPTPPSRARRARISSARARSDAIAGTTSSDACHARNRSASSATIASARSASGAGASERLGDDRLEVVDVVQVAAVELVDRRVEVARDREVDQEQRAARARARSAARRARAEHEPGALVDDDDDVGARELLLDARRAAAAAPPNSLGELARALERSGSRRPRSRAPRETRLRAVCSLTLPAPTTQDPAALEVAEDLLRERRGGRRTPTPGSRRSPVCARAFLPAWSACRKRRSSSAPVAPASNARAPGRGSRPRPGPSSRARRRRGRDAAPRPRRAAGRARSRAPARRSSRTGVARASASTSSSCAT